MAMLVRRQVCKQLNLLSDAQCAVFFYTHQRGSAIPIEGSALESTLASALVNALESTLESTLESALQSALQSALRSTLEALGCGIRLGVRGFLQRAQRTQRKSGTCTALDWADPDPGRAWWAANGARSACGRVERAAVQPGAVFVCD
jgi:hypothetical protein